ncbi:molybdopterin-containing oxidoreductase family protein [Sandarakinorhabdus sp. DWP1-3-1]|uniref:molybdopterin-containing oxidoreductase family protein n=1 Tax=Sandarakinorhabdus sp. DWP1-3-1 TaxID=2804627 RepID=UPI003CF695B2
MAITTHPTFCRFCHANCAMLADVDDDRVVAVRGDPDDAKYHGYTCIKGRQLADAHNHETRLLRHLKRTPAGLQPIATTQVFDEIAARLQAIVAQHGPHSVAVYSGTYAFQNSAAMFAGQAFAKGLGTRNYYTSVTLDQPAKVYTTLRMGHWSGGPQPFSTADALLVVGNNAITSHYGPVGGVSPFSPSRSLQDAKARGLKLVVIDPRITDVARHADVHLAVKPGEDVALLSAIINVILSEARFDQAFCQQHVDGLDELREAVRGMTPEIAVARAGVPAEAIVAAARIFADAKRGVASSGTGPEMSGDGTMIEYLLASLNIVCGRFVREGEPASPPRVFTAQAPRHAAVNPPMKLWGEGFPASRFRGLTQLGEEMPCNVLADEILTPGDGQVKALIVIGGNPVVAFPNQDKMVAAMQALDLLVCIDIRESATTRHADYVLAPAMCLERDDITNLSEWWHETPYARYARALVPAPGDTLDEWEMFWELAWRMDVPLRFAGGEADLAVKPDKAAILDLIAAGCLVPPSQVRDDTPDGRAIVYGDLAPVVQPAPADAAARFTLTPDDVVAQLRKRLAQAADSDGGFRLVSRRTKHVFNSSGHQYAALARKGSTNFAHMNPDDMARLGIAD